MKIQQLEKYSSIAKEQGAIDVVQFKISDIVFDPRTILKCMYGCNDWGRRYNCPSDPKSLKIEESIKIFKQFKTGLIIHANDKYTTQRASFEVERTAFADGYYFAISLSDCCLCQQCMYEQNKPCANPRKARPAFHSVGIDVFATVQKFNLPLATLKSETDKQNWYSAVFIK